MVITADGTRLRMASDSEGKHLWPTEAEAQARRADEAEAELTRLRDLLGRK